MDRKIIISALESLIEAEVVEHLYVRLVGKMVRFDDDGFVVSSQSGTEVSIKKSSALKLPGLVTVDLKSGKKTVDITTFEDILNRDVFVNCFLDSDGSWRATDIYAKVKINQETDVETQA